MKKSIGKKLTLSKTTVSNLGKLDLDVVKGGVATYWKICPATWNCSDEICTYEYCSLVNCTIYYCKE